MAMDIDQGSSNTGGDLLPRHDEFSGVRRAFSVVAITAASGLVVWNAARIATNFDIQQWWLVLVVPIAIGAVDFASGLVHWTADTWGSESLPIVGRRVLHPFRVHHVNPDDFLDRRFIDTNGDLAALVVAPVAAALWIPLGSPAGNMLAVFIVSFCAVGLLTNQFHQWAHMEVSPPVIRTLQRWGVILSYPAHLKHHNPPYDQSYCIATGWCNRPLTAIDFFRRFERFVTLLTGFKPREDDAHFQEDTSIKAKGRRIDSGNQTTAVLKGSVPQK